MEVVERAVVDGPARGRTKVRSAAGRPPGMGGVEGVCIMGGWAAGTRATGCRGTPRRPQSRPPRWHNWRQRWCHPAHSMTALTRCTNQTAHSFGKGFVACLVSCLPALKFTPRVYGACVAVCLGVDVIVNLYYNGKCWEEYRKQQQQNADMYCHCLNRRGKCPSRTQRGESSYLGINCLGSGIPQGPGVPLWPDGGPPQM
jgi:hypothetical protein